MNKKHTVTKNLIKAMADYGEMLRYLGHSC